jgi:tetratricopeptide (TPR) repeat protein
MLRDFGNPPDATRAFEDLLALENGRHQSSVDHSLKGYRARWLLAGIYAELGEVAEAERQFRQVIEESPSFLPAHRGLAELLGRTENQSAATGDSTLSALRRSV